MQHEAQRIDQDMALLTLDQLAGIKAVWVDASAFATTPLGRRDQWPDQLPLRIGQVARIAQLVTVVAMAILDCPLRAPLASVPLDESQPVEPDQARFAN